MKRVLTYITVGAIIFLILAVNAIAAPLLSPSETGVGGQTRSQNYDGMVDGLYTNGKVVSNIGNKMWVPWFKTSSGCMQSDLQSGANCNSGEAIDFQNNCMVTDEFSQVGIVVGMGNNEQRMDSFYNTVLATKSTFGDIPAWRIYRDGDTIQPCRPGINGNCDTASDATARIIISLYTGAKSQYFSDAAKAKYLALANKLSSDMLAYEVEQKCYPTNTGYGQACYWLAGGSQVKRGGFASNDYAYSGYYADAVIAMLMAHKQTGEQKYLDAAKSFTLNYLQAAKTDGKTFRVPPGLAFKWTIDSNGVPQAACTRVCNPDMWDFADAPRAFGMCQANYYAKEMGVSLPGLNDYCKAWGDKYATNTNSVVIQYKSDGSAASGASSGYYYQGLQALFQPGYNAALFKPTVDNALRHYSYSTKTWDNEACYGVYTKAFAVRALGMGIGRDYNAFSSGAIVQPAPTPATTTTVTNTTTTPSTGTATIAYTGIASLQRACSYSSGTQCAVKSDVTSGTCRTLLFGTSSGDIKVMGCEKASNYVELYKQAAPSGLVFSACLANGCVSKDSGFARFIPASASTTTTTPITTAPADTTAPVLSSGLPSGTLAAGTSSATLSVATNENANCRYSTAANVAFTSMNGFATSGTTSHSSGILGLSNGNTYNYFVRCKDSAGNENANDYAVAFSVANPIVAAPAPATTYSGISSLARSCTYGSGQCTLKSDVTSGTCRTLLFGTSSGDVKMMGCDKGNNYVEIYKQAAPSGLVFSACLDKGCVSKDSGFARFQVTSSTTGSTSTTTETTAPTTATPATSTTEPATTTVTAGLDVSKLIVAVLPSGTKTSDVMEGTACRKVDYSTSSGSISARICEKTAKYEMYLLTPANAAKVCVGTNCVGSNSGFASFT